MPRVYMGMPPSYYEKHHRALGCYDCVHANLLDLGLRACCTGRGSNFRASDCPNRESIATDESPFGVSAWEPPASLQEYNEQVASRRPPDDDPIWDTRSAPRFPERLPDFEVEDDPGVRYGDYARRSSRTKRAEERADSDRKAGKDSDSDSAPVDHVDVDMIKSTKRKMEV